MSRAALPSMIQAAIDAGLRVVEIISEPDGTVRLLTNENTAPVIVDELEAKRAERHATKGKRNAHA